MREVHVDDLKVGSLYYIERISPAEFYHDSNYTGNGKQKGIYRGMFCKYALPDGSFLYYDFDNIVDVNGKSGYFNIPKFKYGINKYKAKFFIPENETIIENSIFRYAIHSSLKMITNDTNFMFYQDRTEYSNKNMFLLDEVILKKYQLFVDNLKK